MPDTIEIQGISAEAYIGVPDEERANPQYLRISLVLTPRVDFRDLQDDLARTIDYAIVTEEVRALAAEHPRHLIETLAHDVAETLLARHPLLAVSVLIEKFILPDVDAVAVRVHRSTPSPIAYSI